MSKRLILVICGVVASAMIAVVVIIQLTGSEPGGAEPPREVVSGDPAKQDSRADRTDRGPLSAPAERISQADPSQADTTQADRGPAQASREEFADWVLICPPDGSTRGCLIGQNHVGAESQRSIFAIQLRRSDERGVEALLTTPLHVLLQPGVAFDIGQGDPIRIEFNQCRNEQCQASAWLSDDVVAKLLTAQRARATYQVSTGRTAAIDVSLDGFSEAFAALDR